MSAFWAYPGAHILAMVLMAVLCAIALYQGSCWASKL